MSNKTKKQLSRRNFLAIGGAVAGTAAIAGVLYSLLNPTNQAQSGSEPERLVSKNGALGISLVAAMTSKVINGKTAKVMTYNGTSPGPTWVAKPGDVITVDFTNNLGDSTNLHTHGLHVSPEGNSDNPFIEVKDGETFTYKFQIPENHKEGTFWYHPHHHGMAAPQVFAGLYGAIIIENDETPKVEEDRVVIISDISIASDGNVAGANMMSKMMGREGEVLLVNGQVQPVMEPKMWSVERWRIINSCTSRNLDLALTGAKAMVLGIDGNKYSQPRDLKRVTIAPGNRVDLLVTVTDKEASLTYTTVPHPDAMGMMGSATEYKDYPLVKFQPSKAAASIASLAPMSFVQPDLRSLPVSAKRTFKLWMPSMNNMMDMMSTGLEGHFTINGKPFDGTRIDTSSAANSVEEWTLVNESTMDHPFHLHVWDQQLVSVPNRLIQEVEYQDVVNIPAKSKVVVRVQFSDYAGMSVYHCHILDHEDLGMMGIINVI